MLQYMYASLPSPMPHDKIAASERWRVSVDRYLLRLNVYHFDIYIYICVNICAVDLSRYGRSRYMNSGHNVKHVFSGFSVRENWIQQLAAFISFNLNTLSSIVYCFCFAATAAAAVACFDKRTLIRHTSTHAKTHTHTIHPPQPNRKKSLSLSSNEFLNTFFFF